MSSFFFVCCRSKNNNFLSISCFQFNSGKWSAGLESEGQKTGVDSSVTGTLFQQRPYPSPGAILKANARKAKGGDGNGSDGSNDSDQHPEN